MPRFAVALGTVACVLALSPGEPGARLTAAPVPKHLMPKDTPFGYPMAIGTTWVYDVDGKDETRVSVMEPLDIYKHESAILKRIEQLAAQKGA